MNACFYVSAQPEEGLKDEVKLVNVGFTHAKAGGEAPATMGLTYRLGGQSFDLNILCLRGTNAIYDH